MKYSEEDKDLARSSFSKLDHTGLLLITNKGGNSFSVNYVGFEPRQLLHITWALCVLEGVSCKSKDGWNTISVSGGNFSKADYLAERVAVHAKTHIGYEYL